MQNTKEELTEQLFGVSVKGGVRHGTGKRETSPP